jgi:hypothetical protein
MEGTTMKRITVNDRQQIKQLLYGEGVLGVKNTTCPTFDGFELWWYDKQHDICRCCRSRWSDLKRQIEGHSLDHAAAILWQRRNALFLRDRQLSNDPKLLRLNHLCN